MSDMPATHLCTNERKFNLSYWQFGLVARQARRHVAMARAAVMVNDALKKLLNDIHAEWGELGTKLVEGEIWSDMQARGILLPLSLRRHYDHLDCLYEQLQEETLHISSPSRGHVEYFLEKADEWRQQIDLLVGDRKDGYIEEMLSGTERTESELPDPSRRDDSSGPASSLNLTQDDIHFSDGSASPDIARPHGPDHPGRADE